MKGLTIRLIVREHLCGISKVPKGFPKFPLGTFNITHKNSQTTG